MLNSCQRVPSSDEEVSETIGFCTSRWRNKKKMKRIKDQTSNVSFPLFVTLHQVKKSKLESLKAPVSFKKMIVPGHLSNMDSWIPCRERLSCSTCHPISYICSFLSWILDFILSLSFFVHVYGLRYDIIAVH